MDLNLKNAKLPFGKRLIEAGVSIEDGKIVSISKDHLLPAADEYLDLGGSILMPGVVDPHVHFRDPGLMEKEDFETGSRAALAGGVTTVCDMPNTSPPTDSVKRFKQKIGIAEDKSFVDFGLHGLLPGDVEEGKDIVESGAASLKVYPDKNDDSRIEKYDDSGVLVSLHPEDPEIVSEMNGTDVEDFLKSRPRKAEISEIKKVLNLSSHLDFHFCHLTTKDSVGLVAEMKKERDLSCEVTPHHIFLDESDIEEEGTFAKMHPPLRTTADRKALIVALRNGLIDIVATDHAPHTLEEKKKDFRNAPPGVVGLETSLPLLFSLVQEGRLPLYRMIETMCVRPARTFGLQNENGIPKGTLMPGSDADLVAIDAQSEWKIKGEELHGKTKFTPFEGRKVKGKPFLTMVRGKIMFKEGDVIGEKGHGEFIKAGA